MHLLATACIVGVYEKAVVLNIVKYCSDRIIALYFSYSSKLSAVDYVTCAVNLLLWVKGNVACCDLYISIIFVIP